MPVRMSKDGIARRQAEIGAIKQGIGDLEVLAQGKESLFWKALGGNLEKAAEQAKEKALAIASDSTGSPEDYGRIRLEAGAYKALKMVLDTVNKAEGQIERAKTQVEKLRNELADANDREGIY